MEILPLWLLFALLAGFNSAGWKLANEYFSLSGNILVFWRGLLPALLIAPFTFFIDWPTNSIFYYAVFSTIPIVTIQDTITFEANKIFGAGVSSRVAPLGIFLIFVGWLIIKPEQISYYLSSPLYSVGIVLSIFSIMFFASRLRHCEVSRKAFIFLLPAILLGSVTAILNKTAMDNSQFHQGVWIYIMIQGFGLVLTTSIKEKITHKNLNRFFTKKAIKAGSVVALLALTGISFKGYGFSLVDNPAYFVSITMLAPIWIVCVYKIIGKKEKNIDVKSGLFLVLSVIMLVLFKGMM